MQIGETQRERERERGMKGEAKVGRAGMPRGKDYRQRPMHVKDKAFTKAFCCEALAQAGRQAGTHDIQSACQCLASHR